MLRSGRLIKSALNNSTGNSAEMLGLWNTMLGAPYGGVVTPEHPTWSNNSDMGHFNSPLSVQNTSDAMVESMRELRTAMCTVGLPMVNSSSGHPLYYALVTFCGTNNTVLEVSLLTINQLLKDLMKREANVVVPIAAQVVVMFDQLQNHSALWDSLLAFPQLLSSTSVDQALVEGGNLFTNLQGALHVFQESFPEAGGTLSPLHILLTGGINLSRYVQKWPGRDVYISLGDVVMLQNDTISELTKLVLRQIEIPLDKAICLLLDPDTVRSYICNNSGSNAGLTAACMTGLVDTFLGWISPEKVATQALLMWSKSVAAGDLAFVKGLLHSVMGGAMKSPQDTRRSRRSVDADGPQNLEEDLFVNVGRVVLEVLKVFPDVDFVIQRILRTGLFSMHTANLAINTIEKMITSVSKDVHQFQNTYMMLMTERPEAGAWIDQALNSTAEMVLEVLTPSGPLTCERLLRPYDWLLHSECMDPEAWKALICQNVTNLEQSLAMEWWPLFQMVEEGYSNIFSDQGDNITLPMILSEWHKLCNNTMNFPMFIDTTFWNYLSDSWMSGNNSDDMTETLLQRVMSAVASLGEGIERSPLWPHVGRYVHMTSWILNYKPGNTTEPAHCSFDLQTMDVYCNANVDWPQFVQVAAQTMLSLPTQPEILIRCLKGTVSLLQHVYGNILRGLIALHIPKQIPGGDALSHYMINLVEQLRGFALNLTNLKDSDISNPDVMLPNIYNLLQSTGLTPLMPLFGSGASINAATVLEVTLKLGRQNQKLFTFNESDPTLPDLERLIMNLLSMEGNLTLPLSLSMGHTLLTYSGYLRPEDLASLQLAIQPYTNQTSAGFTEAVLSAMELLNTLTDAPGGDPSNIIVAYVQQLQKFLISALRLRRIDQVWLSSGQLSPGQVTDLQRVTVDLLKLLSPEGLQSLAQAGPNATQQLIMQKLLAFLPVEVQLLATDLVQEVQMLAGQLSFCTSTGQDCVASLSEIIKFLQQVATMLQGTEGNVTIQIEPTNPFLQTPSSLRTAAAVFSLVLPQRDAQHFRFINQTLHFITLLMDTPQLTVAQAQDALRESHLTLAELEEVAALLGAANTNSLLVNIVGLVDVQQCFAQPPSPSCATGLISRVTGFLSYIPALRDESLIFALIPELLNKSIVNAEGAIYYNDPHVSTVLILNHTLANIMVGLHQLNLSSPELMQEIRVLQNLLELASIYPYSMPPFSNNTMIDAQYQAQLEIIQWYIRKLENITSSSEVSSLLYPIYRSVELSVAMQLASTNFSQFVSNEVTNLVDNLEYPIDGAGVNRIGLVIIKLVREQIKTILNNIQLQNDLDQSLGYQPTFNATTLNALSYQTGLYLDLIGNWMRTPNITTVFNSMLNWGNSTLNLTTPGNDIHQLLQSVAYYLDKEQLAYFSVVSNFTQVINKALSAAEQPGGLQSDTFSEAIVAAVGQVIQILDPEIPGPLQQNILAVTADSLQLIVNPDMSFAAGRYLSLQILGRAEMLVEQILPNEVVYYVIPGIQIITTYFETISMIDGQDKWNQIILNELKTIQGFLPENSTAFLAITVNSLQLIINPDMSFATARNISLQILRRAEMIVEQILPNEVAYYVIHGIQIITTYFETISMIDGQEKWNQIILNELKTIRGFLSKNSTAEAYLTTIIDITYSLMGNDKENITLWDSFGNSSSMGELTIVISQIQMVLNKVWPAFTEHLGFPIRVPPIMSFVDLATVLEQIVTGTANPGTWYKLEMMLNTLLSMLQETSLWDPDVPCVLIIETILQTQVQTIQAQNELIQSLNGPLVTLTAELIQSINSSHLNWSVIQEPFLVAIERMVMAAGQTNGTLDCLQVLMLWEPVRAAAGLENDTDTLRAWCHVSLQPVLQSYAAAQTHYANLNISNLTPGAASVTAAGIAMSLRSLYHAFVNSSRVSEQLIIALCIELSDLQPLSSEEQTQWYQNLQEMQLQESLDSLETLTDELLTVAPFLKTYVEAAERAAQHLLSNMQPMQSGDIPPDIFGETAYTFLDSLNLTDPMLPMVWGNGTTLDGPSVYNLMKEVVSMIVRTELFGDMPDLYRCMERFVAANSTRQVAEELAELLAWASETPQGPGMDVLPRLVSLMHALFRAVHEQLDMELPQNTGFFGDLALALVQAVQALIPVEDDYSGPQWESVPWGNPDNGTMWLERNGAAKSRRRRELPTEPIREPMVNFIELFSVDYPALFQAVSIAPSPAEVLETAHVLFANPDLNVVMKGTAQDFVGQEDTSDTEEAIDSVLGVLAYLTNREVYTSPWTYGSTELLIDMAFLLPEGLPYSWLIKNITLSLAKESPENLHLLPEIYYTVAELLTTSLMDEQYPYILQKFSHQVCRLENMDSVRTLLSALNVEPGQLCAILTPAVKILMENLPANYSNLPDVLFTTLVGEPITYNIDRGWTTALTAHFGLNISSIKAFKVNITKPERVAVGEMFRDEAAFVMDVQRYMAFDQRTLHLLLNTTLPDNLATLSWLVSLRHCRDSPYGQSEEPDAVIYRAFCSMSAQQWYTFSLLVARHVSNEKLIYRLVMSEELQSIVGFMLQMTSVVTDMIGSLGPVLGQLQGFLTSIDDLNLVADPAFRNMVRGYKRDLGSRSMMTTMTRALCNNGMMALFGISKLTSMTDADPALPYTEQREEMITKFKIPRDASPFCMNLYLEMVNTTGGAIAWAFLKPMLMGQILYTPDTPTTRAIMEKSNDTLREFANLKQYSADWIESSGLLVNSTKVLRETLPMLKNSLGNAFVKKFIEMQTDINVTELRETLSDFANMGVMLDKNKQALKQITVLSNLMVNVASCIKFDRYQGYDSAEEMDSVAQELAKNRDLYASVIFKLPPGDNRKPGNGSDGAEAGLPRKVSYTIRMHMDNVMRTDRVRSLYYLKDTHIDASQTMRYTRGFIYLQESIDRAIIATHAGHRVAEPAVQLQPFPYPCFMRDEYLEAISFVFPIMLMIAWVLFVADFVKKLVYERELRLHEYMKMMGVNPLSHFCAWFLDCAVHLLFTIVILTLVLKYGGVLPNSDGFLLFLFFCNYGLSIVAMSFLVSSFFDKTYIAGMTGSLVYVLCFFPFIIVMGMETKLSLSEKSALGLLAPTCFSYATQYVTRYEYQGAGIHWSNAYSSPVSEDTSSFGWMCWLLLIDSAIYFLIGGYIRMVFPGQYGLASPWYFPVSRSFWADLCCACRRRGAKEPRGLFITNILQSNPPVFPEDKEKDRKMFSSATNEEFRGLPVGVALHRLSKMYGERVALSDLSVSFYEGHVTSLLGHNGAGKTTTMSLLTGLFAPSSGSIEVYGRDMLANIEDIRKELGVCMQYDVLFDHMTTKEHLLLYGQIKAPHWTEGELREQVRKTLEETGMHAHRHKRVGTLSGGMKRKLSISIAFIGGSRLVVLDEPTTGVDPCSRRSIWDIVIQHKTGRTIVMSTHHLDEAEVLSDRIAFLQSGGLKCCGSPFQLKDRLGQGYKLTLTRKAAGDGPGLDNAELKAFIQAHVPEARLKEAQGSDLVYTLPPFTSSSASSYRSLLSALDGNLDALQLGCYGISDTTLEEVFLNLTQSDPNSEAPLSISESVSDTASLDSFSEEADGSRSLPGDKICLTGSPTLRGAALVWQQAWALLVKRFHHSRRDWKGMLTQILLPVVFVFFAMGLGSVKSDMQHFPEMELSPALYNIGPSYSFFSNRNANSSRMVDAMLSYPGIDNACLDKRDNPVCSRSTKSDTWESKGNKSQVFSTCKCNSQKQVCAENTYKPPHKKLPSSQTVFNLTSLNVEHYLLATTNEYVRNRYGGFEIGQPIPAGLQMDLREVPKDRSLAKVWYNPDGHHSMPAYLNSLNNLILRSNLPADQDKEQYAISVSSHPYFGRADDEDAVVHGLIQLLVAICVMTGYAVTTSSFAIYEVHEHHSGAKRLQHISGIGEPLYWTVNFLYDMTLYLIPVFLTVGVIAAFQIPAFTDRQNLSAVTLLLVLFGFSTFPWMYLLAGVFKDAEMAFISYVCINLFISINTVLPTSILFFMSQISVTDTEAIQLLYNRLSRGLLVFPQFSFGNGLMELARNNMEVQLLSGYGVDAYREPFSAAGLGPVFLSAFLQGLVFFALRLLLNRGLIRKVWRLTMGKRVLPPVEVDGQDGEDEDVTAEHARVSSGEANSDLLQVCRLSKVYQYLNKKVHAVNRVSLGIPAGECFGLLGVNGAGKTTTFKMLTGDVSPTDGTAQIKDVDGRMVDIMECRDQGINIGYCPQVDALDNLLTGKEHLYFYARIRGISKREIDGVVNHLLKKLELVSHRDAVTEGYSCGTRRKLSTALALIGHPQILLLDEPSSGMDPRTKRHLWKIISEEVKGKCAVVLTSHSMEECEALCSRLAIMVKGQFRCLGSLQHIKNRFGSGFTVKMYLALASCDVDVITSFMQLNFPSTYLKDQHSTMVEYHVPVAPGGVADIFHQLETNKNALHIKHFSISQTTLDEVFINFAMGKIGTMDTIPIHNEEADSLDPFGLMPV
ncbi:unnamed protein product [Arctogadus glacialis]